MQREYIINTEHHKRWWLPDNIHYLDEMHLSKRIYLKVVDSRSHVVRQEFHLSVDHTQREYLIGAFSDSADRKYPRNIMKHADSINRLTRRGL